MSSNNSISYLYNYTVCKEPELCTMSEGEVVPKRIAYKFTEVFCEQKLVAMGSFVNH